jgi:hypothetical protein
MPWARKHKTLRIVLFIFLFIIAGIGIYGLWLSRHYSDILRKRIPEMIVKSSDSLYHVTFGDIKINVFRKWVVITDVHLWADTNQANMLRKQGRYSPNTVSYVTAPRVEAYGIRWDNILSGHSFDCDKVIIRDPKWFMQTIKHDPDMTMIEEKQKPAIVTRMGVAHFEIINPSVTYHYVGFHNTYYCYLQGGRAPLYDWGVDRDITRDTSVFLYARHGTVTPARFTFAKDGRNYEVKDPVIEFTSTPTGITLKEVKIRHLADIDKATGREMEVYNLKFPVLEFENFNWKRLLHNDALVASRVNAEKPYLEVHYQRAYIPERNKVGSYPNQLIHEFIQTYIKTIHIHEGTIVYNEPGKNDEAIFQFDNVSGAFSNVTNIKEQIDRNSNLAIKLEGKFMHKSPVGATFDLSLSDPKGHFAVSGYVNNLNGDDVSKQAADFTFAKVTSFHLSHMEGSVTGNESTSSGEFTMLYHDLKISLLNFKNDDRKTKKGPFSFLADALVLYTDNPMPGEPVRKASTTLKRDPAHGLISLIWQNVYLGAQKTAVRNDKFIALAGGKTDDDSKPKKKGFFKKLFGGKLFGKKKHSE